MVDKYKSCEGCTERSVFPNCHSTCKGYLFRVEERKKINKKRRLESEYDSYMYEKSSVIEKTFKRYQKNKKRFR